MNTGFETIADGVLASGPHRDLYSAPITISEDVEAVYEPSEECFS
jgi:hypothetical protein